MPLESLDQVEIVEVPRGISINVSEIEGDIEYPGPIQTAASNVVRGATQSFTAPVAYLGALTGVEMLGDSAQAVDDFVADLTPVDPELADSWLSTYIPQGIGQVGAMIVPGAAFFKAAQTFKTASAAAQAAGKVAEAAQLLSKAQKIETAGKVALFSLMGGAEGNDAYQRSIEQGDDHAEAVAKSLGYASVAAAIENKFGTGLLIRRMEGLLGKEAAAKVLAEKGLTQRVAQDVLVGAGEEASQRLVQDLIVTGKPDVKGILTEGGVGGIIQGIVGLPMNVAMRSMSPQQKAAVAKAEQLVKNGAPATAQVVVEEMLSESLTEADISILEPGEQQRIATEQPTTAQPAPILPTPDVVGELQKNAAPLTAAAVEQIALTPKPKAPDETQPTLVNTPERIVQAPVEERVAAPAVAQAPAGIQATPSGQGQVATQPPTTEVSNAIQIQKPDEGVLRQARPQMGLPRVGTGNQIAQVPAQQVAPVSGTQGQVISPAQPTTAIEQEVIPNVEVQEMRRQEEGRQERGILTPPSPMGVAAEAVAPVAQAPTPETFGSVKELLDFKQTRLNEERALYQREIGLSESEAQQLQDLLSRELSTKRFEKGLTPEQQAKLEYFFEESPYNQKGGPFESWETDKRYSPEDASMAELDDADNLIIGMVNALENAPEQKVNNDRFLYLAIGAKKLQELGISQKEVARAIDRFTTRNSSSQGDKAEYFEASSKRLGDFLRQQGVELPLEQRQRIAATPPVSPEPVVEMAPTSKPDLQVPPTFTKGQRVISDRYGKGEVLRQIGKRFQVQFDDGTKFAVSRQELTPDSETAPAVKPAEPQVMALEWKDAPAQTPELSMAAERDFADAQKQSKKLQKQLAKLEAKEELTDKEREKLTDIQAELQEARQTMQTFEDYQQRPSAEPPKTAFEAAKEEVKNAYQGLYKLGIQPDPAVQLRFYRALYNLAVEAVKAGVNSAAEFIAQYGRQFSANLRATLSRAFEDAQNGKPLPATLDELPPEIVSELEMAGLVVEPTAKPAQGERRIGTAAKNLLQTGWAERNPRLADIIRDGTYVATTNQDRNEIAVALIEFFGPDIEAAYAFAVNPPELSGVTMGIQQSMLSYLVAKAERLNNPTLAMNALRFMKQQRSTMGQDFQGIQAAEELLINEGSPAAWQLRAQSDFADDQRAVIEPVIKASTVREKVQEAKRKASKEVSASVEKLAARFFPKAIKEMGVTMRSIMEQHADSQEATRKALFDRISSDEAFANISAQDRLKLTNELQTLWEKARNKELQRIFKDEAQAGGRDIGKLKIQEQSLPRLVKLINTGALTDESIYNALAPEFDLPYFDEATAAEVFRLAQEMQRAPQGLPRAQKYIDLLNYLALKRRLSKWETLKAYWYASILSGTGTQATNGVAAAVNVQLQNLLLAASNPATAGKIFLGAMRGYAVAFNEAQAILGRGDFSNRITNEVQQQSSALELQSIQGGPVARFFSNFKYVARLMAFVDTMNAMSAMEARAFHLAARKTLDKYRDTPVSKEDINREIFELLKLTDELKAQYKLQAESEVAQGLLDPRDVNRRTQDLIRRNRPSEIMEESLNFGKVATFNNKPVGFVGDLAAILNLGRTKFPALTIVFPFIQTPANVLNELLNYTPVGLWRLAKENPVFRQKVNRLPFFNVQGRDLSPSDYQILRAQTIAGAFTFIGISLLAAEYDDEENPPFDISGGWYGIDGDKRRQLMAQGKRKWSIKVGDTWFDYRQTPLAIMLGTIGNYRDTKKYGDTKDQQANVSSMAYHLMKGAFIVKDMSFLSSFNSLAQLIDPDDIAPIERRFAQFFARPVTGFVPSIVQEIDTWFDPTIQRPETFLEYIQADVPVARSRMDMTMVNVLGQQVRDAKTAGDRFYSQVESDPVWRELSRLADMGVFVPVPSATAKIRQNGERVRMTDEQVYAYRKKAGELYYQKLNRDLARIQRMDAEQAKSYFDRELAPLRERARASVWR